VEFGPELLGNGLEVALGGGHVRAGALRQHRRQVLGLNGVVRRRRPVAAVLGGRAGRLAAAPLFLRAAILLARAARRPVTVVVTAVGAGVRIFRFGSLDDVHFDVQVFGAAHRAFAFHA